MCKLDIVTIRSLLVNRKFQKLLKSGIDNISLLDKILIDWKESKNFSFSLTSSLLVTLPQFLLFKNLIKQNRRCT